MGWFTLSLWKGRGVVGVTRDGNIWANGFILVGVMLGKLARNGAWFVMSSVAPFRDTESILAPICQDPAQIREMEVHPCKIVR